jgi:hypothetical protein
MSLRINQTRARCGVLSLYLLSHCGCTVFTDSWGTGAWVRLHTITPPEYFGMPLCFQPVFYIWGKWPINLFVSWATVVFIIPVCFEIASIFEKRMSFLG